MNKLISVNYWFGCDWCFCEVGYLSLRAGQLSLTCAVVYLWNTGYIRVTHPWMKPWIQYQICPQNSEDIGLDILTHRIIGQ